MTEGKMHEIIEHTVTRRVEKIANLLFLKLAVGSISEKIIFEKIRAGRTMDELKDAPISLIMEESYPVVTESTPISSVTAMMSDCNAVLVARKGKLVGMITKADILKLI